MAKRTGNISNVAELLEGGVSPRALRLALISVHYRQGLDFSDASLDAATAAIERLDARARGPASPTARIVPMTPRSSSSSRPRAPRFDAALDDDLNVSAALGSVFDLVREANRRIADRSLSTADAGRIAALLRDLDTVLGGAPGR